MGATVIALSCGLVFGIGLVLALSPLLSPPPERSVWGPWKRLSEDVERARVPGLSAAGLVLLSLALCAVVAAVVFIVTGAWPVAVIMSVGVAFLPYAWVVSRVAGRAKTVRAAWPEVIDSMVSGVRAGTSLPQVLCDLADEGPAPVRFAFKAFSRDYAAHGRFASAGSLKPASPGRWARPAWGWPPPGSCFSSCLVGERAPTCGTRPEASLSSSAARGSASLRTLP